MYATCFNDVFCEYHEIKKNLSFLFRYIFWTEIGNITTIGRLHMDGTSKSYIATTDRNKTSLWPSY